MNNRITELQEKVKQLEHDLQKNKATYSSLVDSLIVGIAIQIDNKIVAVNKKIIDLFGAKSEKYFIGKHILEFMHPADHEKVMEQVKLIREKSAWQEDMIEERLIKTDGSELLVEAAAILINYHNRPALLIMLNDITNRKLSEKVLIESEEKYRLLADNTIDCIWRMNKDLIFTYINPAIYTMLGFKPEEWTGSALADHCTEQDMQKMVNIISEMIANKMTSESLNINMINKNGSETPVEISVILLFDENNELTGFQGITRDITERIQAEEQLSVQNKELEIVLEKAEESNRLKSEFLNNMSHEIRTPLNGIIGFSSLLDDPTISEIDKKDFIEVINSNGSQLVSIVENILDISKIESGQININPTETCINKVLDENYFTLENELKISEKQINFTLQKQLSDNDSIIFVDKNRLNQVIVNLVINAIKYTNQGFIELGYQLKNNFIEFYVKDSGIGIKEENKKKVFEKFIKIVDPEATELPDGTGLGLSICENFVKLMGGEIWFESIVNKGSVFYFTIPYKQALSSEIETSQSTFQKPDNKKNGQKTVLVAEDVLLSYLLLERFIKQLGFISVHAYNGQEAIDIIKSNPGIRLVLMDMKMPKVDGYEATRQIKMLRNDLPIIGQSAYAMSDDIDKALMAGCDDYVTKPITKEKFMSIVEQYL